MVRSIQDYKMQTRVSKEPKYRGLDGEDNECRLCKHWLHAEYWLHLKSGSSEKIDPHADQKQEINFVWPYLEVEIGISVTPIKWKLFLSAFSKW